MIKDNLIIEFKRKLPQGTSSCKPQQWSGRAEWREGGGVLSELGWHRGPLQQGVGLWRKSRGAQGVRKHTLSIRSLLS